MHPGAWEKIDFVPVGGGGGIKQGRFLSFCVSLVLQCLGVPRYPDTGKNSTKSVMVTPLFVCAPNACKNWDLRAVSPYASRQNTGKGPHFAHIHVVLWSKIGKHERKMDSCGLAGQPTGPSRTKNSTEIECRTIFSTEESLAICDFGLRFLSPKPLLSAGFLAIWLCQRGNR